MSVGELTELKRRAREVWASGDYPTIAAVQLWGAGPRIVRHAAVRPGDEVLDVACGTGNAAIRAAEAGAQVTALDLTPELLRAGERLAEEAGLSIDWVEGDAEDLPFPDASFDVVLSTFGCMFAPRHAVAAAELARVLRPGGRLALFTWTGAMAAFFDGLDRYLPPLPPFAAPAGLWGSEEHVRALFEGSGVQLELSREILEEPPGDPPPVDDAIEFFTTRFGPLIEARGRSERAGTWPRLRAELVEFVGRAEPAEYLVIRGVRSGG
jgi:SAM-dependent methyltransferase